MGADYQKPTLSQMEQGALPLDAQTEQLLATWRRWQDPQLNILIQQAELTNPSLTIAIAHIRQSRATLSADHASAAPVLTANANSNTEKNTATLFTSALDASWEIDLFGEKQRRYEADSARVNARVADWYDARISLAAEVADDYVQYQACRQLTELARQTRQSQQHSHQLTALSLRAGFTSNAHDALIAATAIGAQASLTEQQARCDLLTKALIELTGYNENTLQNVLLKPSLPSMATKPVTQVPANALLARPDLIAMERELAATNAEIGVAEAQRWPSLALSGTISKSGASFSSLATSWLLGTVLSLPLIDGGQHAAVISGAQASYEAQLATYKQGIRTAIKEVSQAFINLASATQRQYLAQDSLRQNQHYYRAMQRYWQAGGIDQLTLEAARRNVLVATTTEITVQRDQLQYWIALYKALGGAWPSEANTHG